MTREAFYVAMARGRGANHAYIDTDTCHGELDSLTGARETRPARTVLEQVLSHQGAEISAHALQIRLTRGSDQIRMRCDDRRTSREPLGLSR